MEQVTLVKIGGSVIDHEADLATCLRHFSNLRGLKVLVHGGGKLATEIAEKLELPQTMIQGRRVTDAATLKIISMVYGGWINKNLVAVLQSHGCQAMGVTGADADLIRAEKRSPEPIDFGFVGDQLQVRGELLKQWLKSGVTPVIAPLTHDGAGQLLNTNADTIANEVATTLARDFEVVLVYSFEKAGVLLDVDDESTLIARMTPSKFQNLKAEGKVFSGMVPKLENACKALKSGVKRVVLGKSTELPRLVEGKAGTTMMEGDDK